MKLQYFKENFYKITTVVAIVALIAIQGQTWVSAQEGEDNKADESIAQTETDSGSIDEGPGLSPIIPNIPNASCLDNLSLSSVGSNVFNPNTTYSILFMREQNYLRNSQLQDINGDNLPDFLLFKHSRGGSTTETTFGADGCVYLNNGSGWDLVFQCMSETTTNNSTGQVIAQHYKGDCAGESSAQQEN